VRGRAGGIRPPRGTLLEGPLRHCGARGVPNDALRTRCRHGKDDTACDNDLP
jgi:hypothetical protein